MPASPKKGTVPFFRRRVVAVGLVLVGFAGTVVALERLLPPDFARLAGVSAVVLDRQDRLLRAFTTGDGVWRLPARPDRVDPRYLEMLLAYEDRRFRYHPGVDLLALARAARQNLAAGRVVSGASTLSMQAARLLVPQPRSLAGKLVQGLRALQLELRLSKDEILRVYLTLAPFGGNLEGVRAASLAYFGKEPARLTAAEAALLVALPQSPSRLRPDRFPGRARAARAKVLAAMRRAGVLTPVEAAEAEAAALPTARRPLPFRAPHLARRLAARQPARAVHRTAVDGTLQAALETLLGLEHPALDPGAAIAALVIENRTREVLAHVGSSDFFDDASAGRIDMTRAVRSPGSALKPFIYGMAFDELVAHPATIVIDRPTRFGDYRPENFRRAYHGEVTLSEALRRSLNVPAVALLAEVGPGRLAARLDAAGARLHHAAGAKAPGLPLALGGVGITLADLTALYAALANGGVAAPLRFTRDQTAAGAPAEAGVRPRLFGPAAAWYLARILEGAPPPAAFVDRRHARTPRAIAYKTGTSYGFRDAWAVGYDAAYTVGIWVGRPDGTPSPGRYGRGTAAPLLFRVFGLLPRSDSPPMATRPDEIIEAAALPPSLRRLAGAAARLEQPLRPPLGVAFPPDGAVLELVRTDGGFGPLPLRAEGGRAPFNWLVNGRAVAARRAVAWAPDGAGYVRITVIDADGKIARAEVRLADGVR